MSIIVLQFFLLQVCTCARAHTHTNFKGASVLLRNNAPSLKTEESGQVFATRKTLGTSSSGSSLARMHALKNGTNRKSRRKKPLFGNTLKSEWLKTHVETNRIHLEPMWWMQ